MITDENGNKYYFEQKEWSEDIIKEDAISFNGIRGESYISSWHITKIEPRNSSPIMYNYKSNIHTDQYISSYSSSYLYGKPIKSQRCNFSLRSTEINWNLSMAEAELSTNMDELYRTMQQYEIIKNDLISTPLRFNRDYQIMFEDSLEMNISEYITMFKNKIDMITMLENNIDMILDITESEPKILGMINFYNENTLLELCNYLRGIGANSEYLPNEKLPDIADLGEMG